MAQKKAEALPYFERDANLASTLGDEFGGGSGDAEALVNANGLRFTPELEDAQLTKPHSAYPVDERPEPDFDLDEIAEAAGLTEESILSHDQHGDKVIFVFEAPDGRVHKEVLLIDDGELVAVSSADDPVRAALRAQVAATSKVSDAQDEAAKIIAEAQAEADRIKAEAALEAQEEAAEASAKAVEAAEPEPEVSYSSNTTDTVAEAVDKQEPGAGPSSAFPPAPQVTGTPDPELKGQELEDRIDDLKLEGLSGATADEKRQAVADEEARLAAQGQ